MQSSDQVPARSLSLGSGFVPDATAAVGAHLAPSSLFDRDFSFQRGLPCLQGAGLDQSKGASFGPQQLNSLNRLQIEKPGALFVFLWDS